MNVEHLAHEFFEWLEISRFSPITIDAYRAHMKRFLKYLTDEHVEKLDELTSKVIYEFQTHLYYAKNKQGESLSIYTQHGALSTVQTFCSFLMQTEKINFDPSSGLVFPRKPKELPEVLTLNEIAKLLEVPDTSTPLGFRDRTIMEVLYATGMRNRELRKLSIYDVDLKNEEITILHGKGNKERVVPIGILAGEYVHEYLQVIRPKLIRDERVKTLFVSQRGKPMWQGDVIAMIKKYVKQAAIEKEIGVHTFRHTCATHLLQGGCDIRYIQKLLGHESIISTQLYTKVEIGDLKAVHEKYHPREKLDE
jgi:integrase/recombinase XerD